MKKIRQMLTKKSQWCQGATARNKSGNPIDPKSHYTASRCLLGWIKWRYDRKSTYSAQYAEVLRMVQNKIGGFTIGGWNDHSDRTFAEVKALVKELDI